MGVCGVALLRALRMVEAFVPRTLRHTVRLQCVATWNWRFARGTARLKPLHNFCEQAPRRTVVVLSGVVSGLCFRHAMRFCYVGFYLCHEAAAYR